MAGGTAVAFTALLVSFPGSFNQKITSIADEFAKWRPGEVNTTSTGSRLDFYRNSVTIVREHPFFGVGTGGFPRAYADIVKSDEPLKSRNPHNEYLHITLQVGVVGLAFLLYLFFAQWRNAPRLATALECRLARGLVLTMAIGCLFNSLLLDHTEGLLYAWLTGVLYAGLQSKRDA
jgi:O-antigen ligase